MKRIPKDIQKSANNYIVSSAGELAEAIIELSKAAFIDGRLIEREDNKLISADKEKEIFKAGFKAGLKERK